MVLNLIYNLFNNIGEAFMNAYPNAGKVIIEESAQGLAVGFAATLAMITGLFAQRAIVISVPKLYEQLVLDNMKGIIISASTLCFTMFTVPYLIKMLFRIFGSGNWMFIACVIAGLIGVFTPQAKILVRHFWPEWARKREEELLNKTSNEQDEDNYEETENNDE